MFSIDALLFLVALQCSRRVLKRKSLPRYWPNWNVLVPFWFFWCLLEPKLEWVFPIQSNLCHWSSSSIPGTQPAQAIPEPEFFSFLSQNLGWVSGRLLKPVVGVGVSGGGLSYVTAASKTTYPPHMSAAAPGHLQSWNAMMRPSQSPLKYPSPPSHLLFDQCLVCKDRLEDCGRVQSLNGWQEKSLGTVEKRDQRRAFHVMAVLLKCCVGLHLARELLFTKPALPGEREKSVSRFPALGNPLLSLFCAWSNWIPHCFWCMGFALPLYRWTN